MLIRSLRNGATLPDIKKEPAGTNRMKTSKIFRSLLLASTLTGFAAHAADPQPPATPSAADLQALMGLLNKLVAQAAATDSAASDEPAPPPAAPVPAARQPLSTALKTGSLRTGSLTTSGGLDARGAGTFLRMTEEAWRLLFPAKQPNH